MKFPWWVSSLLVFLHLFLFGMLLSGALSPLI